MLRYLGALLEIGLIVFCLIECIQAPPARVRNLPLWAWILPILFIPYVGPIAWLVAGRPTTAPAGRPVPWPSIRTAGFPEYERPLAPDDDPEFIARLAASDSSDRGLLSQWEADLREREAKLRDAGSPCTRSGTFCPVEAPGGRRRLAVDAAQQRDSEGTFG